MTQRQLLCTPVTPHTCTSIMPPAGAHGWTGSTEQQPPSLEPLTTAHGYHWGNYGVDYHQDQRQNNAIISDCSFGDHNMTSVTSLYDQDYQTYPHYSNQSTYSGPWTINASLENNSYEAELDCYNPIQPLFECDDMHIRSTAQNKSLGLDLGEGWINKPMQQWTVENVEEWLIALGANRQKLQSRSFRGDGNELRNFSETKLKSLERELEISIYKSFKDLIMNDYRPDRGSSYNTTIVKDEELSQSEYAFNPSTWNQDMYHGPKKEYISGSDPESDDEKVVPVVKTKGRRGRPPTLNGKANKRKPEKRHGRLWEFIRDLLKDKNKYSNLITWENEEEGVFRFVSSEKVAQLWGNKRGNTKMNYEKLSRAMRYYYKSKILQPVTHRRLVYKFGPNATGLRIQTRRQV